MFQVKYLKYKNKYLALKNKMTGGASSASEHNPLLDFIKNDKSPRMNNHIHPEIQKEHNKQIEEAKIKLAEDIKRKAEVKALFASYEEKIKNLPFDAHVPQTTHQI